MKFDAAQHWNKSHLRHPDREPSNYAKDKEKHFPRNSIVCDFGGSDGVDSIYFIEKGHKVYLFDIANLALKQAEKNAESKGIKDNLNTKVVDASKENIPIKDNFFDVVYSRLSIHYFKPNRTVEVLKDIFRVLKKGGIAYTVVKSSKDEKELSWLKSQSKEVSDGVYNNNGLIQTRYTKEQYKEFFKKTGITDYEIGDYIENFTSQKTYVKSGAEKLLYIEIIIKK
jgi:ubiquinone/menaquinone biosynthesis C-methylase UbiE